jgi:uroporphyrinogen decarboxylase
MRQAGRYIPEYRKIRKAHDIMEICKTPELSSDVSAMPINMFGLDAAIVFEDLMVPLEPTKIKFRLVDKIGPVIDNTIKSMSDVENLTEYDVEEVGFVADAIKLLKGKVDVPVIGFAGGPFTMACYMIDGVHNKKFEKTLWMLENEQGVFNRLMDKLTNIVIEYLELQVRAGADAIQLFDTWCGILDRETYCRFIMPYSKKIFKSISAVDSSVPKIHFALNSDSILKDIAQLGCDVIGVDWHNDINHAWSQIGYSRAIQGNLDPSLLVDGGKHMTDSAVGILELVRGRRGHIFNLGHGILPDTKPENVKRLVDVVHAFQINSL